MLVRIALILLFSVVVALLLAFGPGQTTHHVDWVIDGDTFVVGGDHIRVENIDTPELGARAGEEAKRVAVELLYDEDVILDCHGVDRYDRRLCLVEVNGFDYGEFMVSHHYAREWSD
jgi:endonuclease YncB( thermonuclease family)